MKPSVLQVELSNHGFEWVMGSNLTGSFFINDGHGQLSLINHSLSMVSHHKPSINLKMMGFPTLERWPCLGMFRMAEHCSRAVSFSAGSDSSWKTRLPHRVFQDFPAAWPELLQKHSRYDSRLRNDRPLAACSFSCGSTRC